VPLLCPSRSKLVQLMLLPHELVGRSNKYVLS